MTNTSKIKVLMEMRPALDGFAGIPQECRLLFRGLGRAANVELQGLMQTSLRFLSPGMRAPRAPTSDVPESERINRYSRLVLAIDAKPASQWWHQARAYVTRRRAIYALALGALLPGKRTIGLSLFEPAGFEEFVWDAMFAKSLHEDDFEAITRQQYQVCGVPWTILHLAGLAGRRFGRHTRYPRINTAGADVLIAQTPFPARLAARTALVVRYHDALPLFMPHAFANKSRHQMTHFRALESNVREGAYFACVSEATRQDLLRVFPQAAARAVTIHNMVSHHYFEEDSDPARVADIIRARLNTSAEAAMPRAGGGLDAFYRSHLHSAPLRYLLMVATIEPRKNHSRLVAAWQALRARGEASLKLVIVGGLGWDTDPILREMRAGLDCGGLFLLNQVPAADLRVLYRHAAATVCPSLAEGFDFPGVEAMRSGGVVVASDIPVHREVFADAAEYFRSHSSTDLADAIARVVLADDAPRRAQQLRVRGRDVGARYLPERIQPQWEQFLARVAAERVPP
ncbi:MAG: glycosyltransferase family 1 protein [Pseudomonadota bacterium]